MGLAMKIRKERCRKITDKDVKEILGDLHEEQRAGKIAMDEILSRLLSPENCKTIDDERGDRFRKKPFNLFFFVNDEEFRDDDM